MTHKATWSWAGALSDAPAPLGLQVLERPQCVQSWPHVLPCPTSTWETCFTRKWLMALPWAWRQKSSLRRARPCKTSESGWLVLGLSAGTGTITCGDCFLAKVISRVRNSFDLQWVDLPKKRNCENTDINHELSSNITTTV